MCFEKKNEMFLSKCMHFYALNTFITAEISGTRSSAQYVAQHFDLWLFVAFILHFFHWYAHMRRLSGFCFLPVCVDHNIVCWNFENDIKHNRNEYKYNNKCEWTWYYWWLLSIVHNFRFPLLLHSIIYRFIDYLKQFESKSIIINLFNEYYLFINWRSSFVILDLAFCADIAS